MKKFLAAILAAVMIIAVFPLSGLANAYGLTLKSNAANLGPTISSEHQEVNAGETITIPINITNNDGLMGFSISLKYDATKLTPVSVDGGELFSSGSFQDSIGYSEAGVVTIVWTGSENVFADGTLFTIDFDVSSSAAGETNIDIVYSQGDTFNEEYEDVIFNCSSIGLTIINTSTLINVGDNTVTAGETVTVPVDIIRSNGFGVIVLTVTYDAEKLTPTEVTNGLATVLSNNIGTSAGSITIVLNSISESIGDGTLFSVSFLTNENCSGVTSIAISSSDGTSCQNGTVTILEKEKTNSANLLAENITANSTKTIKIPVSISNNPGIMGFKISVKYDSKVLTPVSVGKGGILSVGSFDDNSGIKNGGFDIIWNSSEDLNDNGELFYLEFYVSDVVKATTTDVEISYSQQDTFNENWEDVIFICPNIKVTINPARIIDNYVLGLSELTQPQSEHFNSIFDLSSGQYLNNYAPTLNGYMGTGSTVDYYDSDGSLLGTYTFIVYGDINGDSIADALDAAFVALVVNGYTTATKEQAFAANAGVLEDIDLTSYQNIVNIIVGKGDISYNEASKDGEEILEELNDISCDIYIAADYQISSNSPVLLASIGSSPISWSVDNTKNYEIVGDVDTGYTLNIKSYEGLVDEELTLTATIDVYDGIAKATRDFKVNSKVLRADESNTGVASFGFSETLVRNSEFSYIVSNNKFVNDNFSQEVRPVVDSIRRTFSAIDKNGNTIDANTIISEVRTNGYKIKESAPIGAVLTILTQIGHYSADSEFICDYSFSKDIEIAARTFNVDLVLNGGKATLNDIQITDSYELGEGSLIFDNLIVEKYGYNLEGWYSDASFINKITYTKMPTNDITLYAKWVPNMHKLYFDSNGGICGKEFIDIVFDSKFGTLPIPKREYFEFQGWYTSTDWAEEISSETILSTDEDITVHAKWTPVKYSMLFDANEGVTTTTSKEITCFEAIGELPAPTRNYYTFKGWFTELEGGTQITETDIINSLEDITVYAQWEENPLSDWILVSELPESVKNAPEGMYKLEYADGYSTSTAERKTSGYVFEEGWTMEKKTLIGDIVYGAWGSKAPQDSTESETYHTILYNDTVEAYACHAYTTDEYTPYWWEDPVGGTTNYSKHIYIYSSKFITETGYRLDTDGSYECPKTIGIDAPGDFGEIYLMVDVYDSNNPKDVQSVTTPKTYTYWWPINGTTTLTRTATAKYQYTHVRWSDWSEMTMEKIEPTDSLKVNVTENAYVRYRLV